MENNACEICQISIFWRILLPCFSPRLCAHRMHFFTLQNRSGPTDRRLQELQYAWPNSETNVHVWFNYYRHHYKIKSQSLELNKDGYSPFVPAFTWHCRVLEATCTGTSTSNIQGGIHSWMWSPTHVFCVLSQISSELKELYTKIF